jgi:hypothetical protein
MYDSKGNLNVRQEFLATREGNERVLVLEKDPSGAVTMVLVLLRVRGRAQVGRVTQNSAKFEPTKADSFSSPLVYASIWRGEVRPLRSFVASFAGRPAYSFVVQPEIKSLQEYSSPDNEMDFYFEKGTDLPLGWCERESVGGEVLATGHYRHVVENQRPSEDAFDPENAIRIARKQLTPRENRTHGKVGAPSSKG